MPETAFDPGQIVRGCRLAPFTTLRAGGKAESLLVVRDADQLAAAAEYAQSEGIPMTTLGGGSNVLPSDAGVPGLTVLNLARRIQVSEDGAVEVDCGAPLQDLFLKTVQRGLAGFSFAVGIPGSVGGALVSNAGAYRANISDRLTGLEVVESGLRRWVSPAFMEFSYRDSRLRRPGSSDVCLVRARFQLEMGDAKALYDQARDYQRQRIGKQPPQASAGSFFKNVNDKAFAEGLDGLPPALKEAGVVPAGHLVEKVGLKGFRWRGASVGLRHANFILNSGGATAGDIRRLAEHVAASVYERFGVRLEEEVLYLGDWSGWQTTGLLA
ncbi:MAG: UDP-N-acetylmuramate dehydrogenase [Armatimonadetes bacterium]|nr:UDP-N-acetylmuramate dehydrogenase [Armatimonadota bacterium]